VTDFGSIGMCPVGGIYSCEKARWIEVAQDCTRQWVFVLAMSKLTVILLQNSLISKMDLTINFKKKMKAWDE
jgi:hypothetical protein